MAGYKKTVISHQPFTLSFNFKRNTIPSNKMPPKGKKSKSDFILCVFCGERPKEGPNGPYMSEKDLYETKGLCAHAPWCKEPNHWSYYQCGWCDHFNLSDTICGCLNGERPQKVSQVLAYLGDCIYCTEEERMEESCYCYSCHSELYQSQWKLYAYPPF